MIENGKYKKRQWPAGGLKVLHLVMGLDMGGAERLLADALPMFDRDRYGMEVVAIGSDGPMGDVLREHKIPVTVLNGSYLSPGFLLKLSGKLKSDPPHILDTHLYWPGVLGRTLGHRSKVKVVISHEHIHPDFLSDFRRRIERPTFKWADAVVAGCNDVLKARVGDLPPEIERHVIHYGISLGEIGGADLAAAARKQMGVDRNEMVAGWIGRVDDAQKGVGTMLDAAQKLKTKHPSLKWILIGDGPDREKLRMKTQRLGLDERVTWLGKRPDGRRLYSGMDMYVFPSRFEGMPISIIEAMAAGVPVVATSVAGIPELVEDGVTGHLIPPDDPVALAETVSRLVENDHARKTMGDAGRVRVEELFTIEKFVENTDRLYRGLWMGKEFRCVV